MKKKYILLISAIFSICLSFFIINTYKLSNLGNNINKSDDIDILNISSYEAIMEVEVFSNKNSNRYIIKQKYAEPNIIKQEIIEPENIKGIKTIYDGNNLIIENQTLDLKTIYDNYNYINRKFLEFNRIYRRI